MANVLDELARQYSMERNISQRESTACFSPFVGGGQAGLIFVCYCS